MLEERSIEVSKAEADNRTLKERLNHLQNDLELSEGSIGGSSEDYPSDFDDSMNVPRKCFWSLPDTINFFIDKS